MSVPSGIIAGIRDSLADDLTTTAVLLLVFLANLLVILYCSSSRERRLVHFKKGY